GIAQGLDGMAVTPSGGVVMVGAGRGPSAIILALTSTGQLDTTFNGTGYRIDQVIGTDSIYYHAVAVQPAARGGYRVLVAGQAFSGGTDSGLVVAFTSAGQFDPTFATGGVFTTAVADAFKNVALEADNSIVVLGDSGAGLGLVGHLSADGVLDTS